jgi:glycosyltransferase involved in cell wall biosynthesis
MIYAVLPTGSFHGWGVCGKYLVKELSKISEVRLLTEDFSFENVGDEFDFRLIKSKLISEQEHDTILKIPATYVNFPVLQCITGNTLQPMMPNFRGAKNMGYTFFDDNILTQASLESARRYFDVIVTGSSWCEGVLRNYGIENITTIIQGIDPTIFNPFYSEKEYFDDLFVIFSGGKFELRKGQDIVIRAFKALQDRHKDVLLINSWYNFWPWNFNTMSASQHIKFSAAQGDYMSVINKVLYENGIDIDRVITLPLQPNIMMARIYKNTDVGIFPNRCEGGTNLVLMEYMACAKPVIASYNSGHKDILTDTNSVKLIDMSSISIVNNNVSSAIWEEPNLDETIAKLEWAYNNRESLKEIGKHAGKDLGELTWGKTARRFLEILINKM